MRIERVLAAGVTGRLGRELVRELKQRGYHVRASGRDVERLRRLCPSADEFAVGNALRMSELRSVCEGMYQVVSCLGASAVPLPRYGRAPFFRSGRTG